MQRNIPKYDLVVVGLGLVGSTAALLAASLKLRVAIVETKYLNDLPISKAGRIDAEVYRIFMQMGLQQDIAHLLHPLKGSQIIDKERKLLFELIHNCFEETAPLYSFYQPEVQEILLKKIKTQPNITIYSPFKAEAIEQHKNLVQIHLQQATTQQFSEIYGRFLVLCNGRESLIPEQMNIPYRYYGDTYYNLNVDTKTTIAIKDSHFAQTICDMELPVSQIINQNNHQRWEFRITTEQMSKMSTPEKVRELLEQLIPVDFEIIATYVHRFEVKLLNQWQCKRIFIVGDAAHVLPPYLGLGLSAGIKDTHQLIWKIAMVVEKQVGGHILDYYQGEREPSILQLLHLNKFIERLFQTNWLKWIRRLKMIVPKFILRKKLSTLSKIEQGLVGSKYKNRGSFFLQATIRNVKGQTLSLDQFLGVQHFTIMAFDEDPVDLVFAQEIDYLAKINIQFVKIIPKHKKFKSEARYSSIIYDEHKNLENWFKKNKLQTVILRPDQIIFDAAKNHKQLKAILKLLAQKMPLYIS